MICVVNTTFINCFEINNTLILLYTGACGAWRRNCQRNNAKLAEIRYSVYSVNEVNPGTW
jgi:hypothetical protein